MQLSHIMERAREKAQEAAERTGKAINKGLMEGWSKTKILGRDLKKELSRGHRKIERNKTSKKRRKRKGDKQ